MAEEIDNIKEQIKLTEETNEQKFHDNKVTLDKNIQQLNQSQDVLR